MSLGINLIHLVPKRSSDAETPGRLLRQRTALLLRPADETESDAGIAFVGRRGVGPKDGGTDPLYSR